VNPSFLLSGVLMLLLLRLMWFKGWI